MLPSHGINRGDVPVAARARENPEAWSTELGLGTCIVIHVGDVGRLKLTSRWNVMNSPFWKLGRQTFHLYQPSTFLWLKELLVNAKMG